MRRIFALVITAILSLSLLCSCSVDLKVSKIKKTVVDSERYIIEDLKAQPILQYLLFVQDCQLYGLHLRPQARFYHEIPKEHR